MNSNNAATACLLYFLSFLANTVSAEVIYQDLHLVPKLCKAHGLTMGIAFVLIMPFGVVIIRILKSSKSAWVHGIWQLLGVALSVVGLALGIRLGDITDMLHKSGHTILGTVVVALLLVQPFLGLIHHRQFRSKQVRTVWSYAHVWFGRILIPLGIINGGLGLKLADNTRSGKIVYGVVAGLVVLVVSMTVAFSGQKTRKETDTAPDIAMEERNVSTSE